MAFKMAEAYVELSERGFGGVSSKIDAISGKFSKMGTVMAGVGGGIAAVGGGIVTAFIPAIQAGSDLQETLNKFNVVFGQNADAVKAWGDEFAGQVGRSKEEVAAFLANTQDLFVPLGFEPGAAEKMSKQITSLAVDLASFNNMADADVVNDLQAALTGSGEVMKKYGVIVSEAAVKQDMLNRGLDPSKVTEQDKVLSRLNIIMAGTTAAQGDAIRSSDSFANQMKALKASIADTSAAIGTALLPTVTPLITKVGEVAKGIAAWVDEHRELMPTILKVAAGVAAFGTALAGIGTVLAVAGPVIGGLTAFTGSAVAMSTALTLAKAGAVGLAVAGIAVLAKAVYNANPAMRDFNEQLERAQRLNSALGDATSRRHQNILADVAVLDSPDAKRSALQEQLRSATTEVGGMEAQVKSAQRQFDELNTTFNRSTGNKLLENAASHLKETQERAEASKRWVLDLKDALADVGRQEKLASAVGSPAQFAAAISQQGGRTAPLDLPGLAQSVTSPGRGSDADEMTAKFANKIFDLLKEQFAKPAPATTAVAG